MARTEPPNVAALRARLDHLSTQGHALELEGLPFPTVQIREAFDQAVETLEFEQAARVVKGGESLLLRVSQDWTWVRELLRRADELRSIAATLGVDLQHLDTRVGNPRTRLQAEPLSSGSMEKAAASASLALAVLNDAIPKFCVQEAQNLGESIRRARNRGEEVTEASKSFSRLLQAIQDQNLAISAQRLVETRRAVSRIPRAPAMPAPSPQEEEEILREARNLARRLQRIKGKARDAQSAARLMSQVRAALSEDRRYGTPEEEIEALWLEVDRMTRERKLALETGPAPIEAGEVPAVGDGLESADAPASTTPHEPETGPDEVAPGSPEGEEDAEDRSPPVAFLPYNPYVPPEIPAPTDPATDPDAAAARARNRTARPRP
ncbi:MAG TPA: hypothetical protein VMG14_02705 [Thermoplasmata archaeon]|nr:hypothetical protein [Thermoplasmata archaeon]